MVSPPGVAVSGDVLLTRDINWGETIWQEFLLLAVQPGIWDAPKFCGGGEDLDQWAVVQAEEEVV